MMHLSKKEHGHLHTARQETRIGGQLYALITL
jgi:hypothetical protein